jgi:hypothetical protein
MHNLTGSLSLADLGRLLHLSPEAAGALLASGQLRCSVIEGEPRLPLDELERFFRDALLRLYQTEAWLERMRDENVFPEGRPQQPPAQPREAEESFDDGMAEDAEAGAFTGPPEIGELAQEDRGEAASPAPGAVPSPEQALPSVPRPTIPSPPVRDLRQAPRYIPRRQIDGIFGDVKFSIVQISATGLRIRHEEPLGPGDEAKLSFALLKPQRSFLVRARVVWTSVANYEGDDDRRFCISGLRITEHEDRIASAIEILRRGHDLQPDRRALPRPGSIGYVVGDTAPLEGISDDEVALVMKAATRFAADPLEASRWYGRARFSVAEEQVRRDAPAKPQEREQVLGIWEYLERHVEIAKISGVLSWMRRSRSMTL